MFLRKIMLATATGLLLSFASSNAQETATVEIAVGKPFPATDKWILEHNNNGIKNWPRKGKWTILYFWSKGCAGCLKSLPALNEYSGIYKKEIDFILVGRTDVGMRELYDKYAKNYKLHLPIVYDTTMFNAIAIRYVPYAVVINQKGTVHSITNSTMLTRLTLDSLVGPTGYTFPRIPDLVYEEHMNVTMDEIMNGKRPFYKYSLLLPYTPGQLIYASNFSERFNWSNYHKNGIVLAPAGLTRLYQVAYLDTDIILPDDTLRFGKYWPSIIGEKIDSSFFTWDVDRGTNMYSYALFVNKKNLGNKELQRYMQQDLEQMFPYRAKVEERMMPCYLLKISSCAKKTLRASSGDSTGFSWSHTGFLSNNSPISKSIRAIWSYHQRIGPILDSTGITGNVNLRVEAVMTDLNSINDALKKNGLELVKSEKLMKVLVVEPVTVCEDRTSITECHQ